MKQVVKHYSWFKIAGRRQIALDLMNGKIGVLPTDTIYGLLGSALKSSVVQRIYRVRRRPDNKPMIVLISSWQQIKELGVVLTPAQKKIMTKHWPGPISFIVSCPLANKKYLHRGGKTVCLRWPANPELLTILRKSGPLVAPSANLAGQEPALSCQQAELYFGKKIDFYCSVTADYLKPIKVNKASTLVDLINEPFRIIRVGAIKKI